MELSLRERWMKEFGGMYGSFKQVRGRGGRHPRTAAEFRSLLKSRKKGAKFEVAERAFKKLLDSLESNESSEFISACEEVRRALKFQGYLKMEVVFLEWRASKMSEDEMKRSLLIKNI